MRSGKRSWTHCYDSKEDFAAISDQLSTVLLYFARYYEYRCFPENCLSNSVFFSSVVVLSSQRPQTEATLWLYPRNKLDLSIENSPATTHSLWFYARSFRQHAVTFVHRLSSPSRLQFPSWVAFHINIEHNQHRTISWQTTHFCITPVRPKSRNQFR